LIFSLYPIGKKGLPETLTRGSLAFSSSPTSSLRDTLKREKARRTSCNTRKATTQMFLAIFLHPAEKSCIFADGSNTKRGIQYEEDFIFRNDAGHDHARHNTFAERN